MEANVNLGKIFGIPVGLHLSWFLIFILLTWSLATGFFPREYPALAGIYNWALGLVTSLLFFGSVLAHELAHSVVAKRNQVPVRRITLFIFGGVAQIDQEPRSAGAEFRIAIAGPATSLTLAAIFAVVWWLERFIPFLAAPMLWLARINFILAVFNLIPGFPLDGGRVLRSIVWKITKNYQKATHIATFMGQIVAVGFIGLGIFTIFRGNFLNGIWFVFIGWFLQNAAAASYAQTSVQHALRGVTVSQVMSRECAKVPRLLTLRQLVDEKILSGGQRCFFVAGNGDLEGMITLRDIAAVPQQKWRFTTTEQVMVPYDRLVKVHPDMELLTALHAMDDANVAQVPVVEGNSIVGMLSREQILHYIRIRSELGI